MNAISQIQPTDQEADEKAERRAHHLAVCRELVDCGMDLARRAARRAVAEDEAPQPPETPAAKDPNLTFTRLGCSVRQAVILENTVANGSFAGRPRAGATSPKNLDKLIAAADHGTLNAALCHLTEDHEDRWQLQETFNDIIEDTLSTFPEDPLPTHFTRICLALDIKPTRKTLPPDLAELLTPTATTAATTTAIQAPPEQRPRAQPA